MEPIYLDYNATTPVHPEVASAMRPFLEEHFGNPSSGHVYGRRTREAVEAARRQAADFLGCLPEEIVFTSGGTESNNHAIRGAALAGRGRGDHIVTSAVEHPAVSEVCRFLTRSGFRLTVVPVDATGLVDPEEVRRAVTPETILISVMHANNEVGTIQPIEDIAGIARDRGIVLHTDAAQSAGKIPVGVSDLGVDLLSIAGHKLYAPKGVGILYIRNGTAVEKLMHGADHERDRRAGTENVLEIAGLGQACEIAGRDLTTVAEHARAMRDRLWEGLERELGPLSRNGNPEHCLPNTLSVGFEHVEANSILSAMPDVAASAGAACHSGGVRISAVLTAMCVPRETAAGTIRFSTGRGTRPEDVDRAAGLTAEVVKRLRRQRNR
jgi:cysteine desulfurase